jgi:hypothetical protein
MTSTGRQRTTQSGVDALRGACGATKTLQHKEEGLAPAEGKGRRNLPVAHELEEGRDLVEPLKEESAAQVTACNSGWWRELKSTGDKRQSCRTPRLEKRYPFPRCRQTTTNRPIC